MSSALFWDIAQHAVAVPYRRVRQPVGRSLHVQEIQETFLDFLTLEEGTDTLPRNVVKELTSIRCVMSQNRAELVFFAAES
jgi:hypothetical protein